MPTAMVAVNKIAAAARILAKCVRRATPAERPGPCHIQTVQTDEKSREFAARVRTARQGTERIRGFSRLAGARIVEGQRVAQALGLALLLIVMAPVGDSRGHEDDERGKPDDIILVLLPKLQPFVMA